MDHDRRVARHSGGFVHTERGNDRCINAVTHQSSGSVLLPSVKIACVNKANGILDDRIVSRGLAGLRFG